MRTTQSASQCSRLMWALKCVVFVTLDVRCVIVENSA